MMKSIIVTAAFLGSAVYGADLTFVSDVNCTGQALYGRRDLPSVSCYNMTNLDTTKSVILANMAPGETINFFSDAECRDKLFGSSTDTCYTEPDTSIHSFQVQTSQPKEASNASTTDVVPYGIKLSNYKGLTQSDPYHIDLSYSTFALGVILGVAGQVGALSAIAIGCALVDSTNVLSIFGCIVGPIASVVSYVGGYILASQGRAINQAIQMASGTFTNVKHKRETVDSANADFMSTIMKRDDGSTHGEHVGFMRRDAGNGIEQRSPLYEMDFGKGGVYHVTAFFEERSGRYIHHMHKAEESNFEVRYDSLNKRQVSYNDVRWNTNGLDWSECTFSGSSSGFTTDPGANWQTAYDQLSCLLQGSTITTTAQTVEVDLLNEASTTIGSIQILGYKGSTYTSPSSCSNPSAPFNEDCLVN